MKCDYNGKVEINGKAIAEDRVPGRTGDFDCDKYNGEEF